MDRKMEQFPKITTIFRGTGKPRGLFAQASGEKRVAAYCRVSTLLETQALSIDTQMAVFRQKIMEHPGWKLVDVYADEGISGTSVKKRKAFMQMIADCEAGKIDYIITKSISRFARNTLECINYVRYLKGLGVHILFEKENLDTGKEQSEMILTVLAGFAQEESHSISENVKWGIRKKYERGTPRWCNCYGFRKGEKNEMLIEPEEANVVRCIFRLYECGSSLREIADGLNDEGIPSPRGKQWVPFTVSELLGNEKYKGDVCLQKFVSVDHLSHKSVVNDATEVPCYYITDHHKGIVSPACFDRVQKIRRMKNNVGGHIPQYPYGEMGIRCPLCGQLLVQRNTRGNYKNRIALGCFTMNGCGQYALRMNMLSAALIEAYNGLDISTLKMEEGASMHIIKKEKPRMETVEFYWLEALVERIEITAHIGEKPWKTRSLVSCWDLVVYWRCGLTSTIPMNLRTMDNEPQVVAEQYWINEARYRTRKAATDRMGGDK